MTETQQALATLVEASDKLEPLWFYFPNRPLGWLCQIIDGAIDKLRDEVLAECGGPDLRAAVELPLLQRLRPHLFVGWGDSRCQICGCPREDHPKVLEV